MAFYTHDHIAYSPTGQQLPSYDDARAVYGPEEIGLSNEEFAAFRSGSLVQTAPAGGSPALALGAVPPDWGVSGHIGNGSGLGTLPKWLVPAVLIVGVVLLASGK